MKRSILIRIAAVLAFVTCLGHTVGTFMKIPAEQVGMHQAIAVMKSTLVPMPVGASRSYMQILDGNNLCTSLFLLLCGALLFAVSGAERSPISNRIVLLTSLGLAGFALLSGLYFFPVPTVLTGLASILGFVARSRP